MAAQRHHGKERRQWRQLLWRLAQDELVHVLLVTLAIVAGTWGFMGLAGEVLEGDTYAFDRWVVQALRSPEDSAWPLGPRWLVEVGRDVTAFGSSVVVILLTGAVVGYLCLQRKYGALWLVVVATAGGGLLGRLLKKFFARERPEPVPCLWVSSPSFPSGHAMLAAVVYLTLGILLAQLEPRPLLKAYFLGVMMTLAFMVGLSRVYLGVHYPTDVLGGWAWAWSGACSAGWPHGICSGAEPWSGTTDKTGPPGQYLRVHPPLLGRPDVGRSDGPPANAALLYGTVSCAQDDGAEAMSGSGAEVALPTHVHLSRLSSRLTESRSNASGSKLPPTHSSISSWFGWCES